MQDGKLQDVETEKHNGVFIALKIILILRLYATTLAIHENPSYAGHEKWERVPKD